MLKKISMTVLTLVFMGVFLLIPSSSLARSMPKGKLESTREMRAVWVASVYNLDWPSKKGLPRDEQKQEFIQLLDDIKAMNMNTVIMQIKPTADAFYPSKFGPWSEYLTGIQGKDPGYDPLEFMIEEAHKRGLEFHAWFNPYRITMNHTDLNRLSADHPARAHPDWTIAYGNQLYFNPGIPDAQDFIVDGIEEVVKNYDIDAVHMDDYFYPNKIAGVPFPDQETYETYGQKFTHIEDWRRDNVNELVKQINDTIKKEKPYVKFGISPFGVWRNIKDDPTGSNTTAGMTNYDDLYADTREWIQQHHIDYITPQIYWSIGFQPAAYDVLTKWWSNEVKGQPVHLYIGQATYKINQNSDPAWYDPEEYFRQIELNRQSQLVQGSMHFSLKDINRNPLNVKKRLIEETYSKPALIPEMPWLHQKAPKKPIIQSVKKTKDGAVLQIQNDPHSSASYYAVYRLSNKGTYEFVQTVRKETGSFTQTKDILANQKKSYTYKVTALNRLHHESKPSTKTVK
ncbi:glycoside hydrolase family 10 protein [Bacillus altitudinis]|uniref:glycoside hydrolase family 10 protein n=1 Tax=Bacillus altitudinis TaxID=293387 RepID=UPI0011B576B6|nr:family 10 glycosylhydrolase [Bacillus altitudinis]QDZ96987.1 glycoside hydrolase family 10 protein [Bacillus altitudinis]